MTKVEHHLIREIRENSSFETRLYNLFKAAISDQVSITNFRKMFLKLEKMDIYIMKKDAKDIGLAYFMYCNDPENKKNIYVRPGIGVIKEARDNGAYFPKSIIMNTMIKTKFRNLSKKVFMVSVTMNPIVYVAACKYWRYVYPKPTRRSGKSLIDTKNKIIDLFHMNEVKKDVIEISFSLPEIEETKREFSDVKNDNIYANFFSSKIKNEECNRGMLTVIPINAINLIAVVRRKTKDDIKKSFNRIVEEKLVPLFKRYSPAG
ncbi:hypothetical protein [Aquimarina sp. MMG016]|uniref:hypothetical protein n=1 Tax=Aquimarina sp. MMG016 TaxID=2822690 RepID=UPI001B3A15C0|nr:hypothetical protein [Aquimarina sp. MMG016]MBQ4819075.1 hypothetical protein [Aquimarina sp. MMG016]